MTDKKFFIGAPPRCGKTISQQAAEAFKKIGEYKPKCEKCGAELEPYWYYGEHYMFQKCEKCGELNRKERVE